MVAVARQIHCRTTAPGAPFVCGSRPRESDLSVKVRATHADPATAFELAAGAMVCVLVVHRTDEHGARAS
jgi:hypothetical protein